MKWTYLVEITEVVQEEESWLPFAINLFRRSSSAVGRFFIVLFLWWLMIPEAIVLGIIYVLGFGILLALACVPILNICMLKDAREDDDTLTTIVSIIGILIDIGIIIWLIVSATANH